MITSESPSITVPELTQVDLDNFNVAQNRVENRSYLDGIGGPDMLIRMLGVSVENGLSSDQVLKSRIKFGSNTMPSSRTTGYLSLLFTALHDRTLLVLIAAATVSWIIGYLEDPKIGWIEGTAIFIAVFLVSNISAFNDYNKELQFRALEKSSQNDQKSSVLRNARRELVSPDELVVGDILVLQVSY